MLDREKARRDVLAAVQEMANEYPESGYCSAREQFGLLGRIKRICGNLMPTAKQCREHIGLDRSKLVDEFFFAQDDLRKAKTSPLYPHQERALKALRDTNRLILQVR